MKPIVITSITSLVLASCALGPDPTSPNGPTPDKVRGDDSPGSVSLGDKSWRELFTDPTLRSLIDRALKNNPDLIAATYRIEQARALAGATRASWFPRLDGKASANTSYMSENLNGIKLADRDSESYDLTALLSWELDLWGGIRRSNQAARARLLESEHRQNAVKTSLIADVANAYIDLENLDERLAISKRTAESRKASLDLVVARRDGGISSNLEVGQAEALLGEAQIAIPITEKAIAAKENEIRALLGEFPGGIARSGTLDGLDTSLSVTAGLPSSLLERRSDVAAANQAFQAATAEIGVAQALRLPSLSLTGSGGFASADLTTLLEGGSGNFIVGPRLSGPIFDAGRAKFGVKAAQARAGEALASYEKASKQAFREAADAIDAHRKAGEIIQTRSRLVESLKQVSVVAKDRFEGGASDYLEVLDAERSLFNGELQYADDRRDRLKAVVLAYRALGGGWK